MILVGQWQLSHQYPFSEAYETILQLIITGSIHKIMFRNNPQPYKPFLRSIIRESRMSMLTCHIKFKVGISLLIIRIRQTQR